MKSRIDEGSINTRIAALDQHMAQETQRIRNAIQITDTDVANMNARFAAVEQATNGAISEAVTAAADAKVQGISEELSALMAAPSSASSAGSTAGSGRSGPTRIGNRHQGPHAGDGPHGHDSNPCRVFVGGFLRPVLAKVMLAFADALKPQGLVPAANAFQPKAFNLDKSFSIDFDDPMHDRDFVDQVKETGVIWRDTKAKKNIEMRARIDAPSSVRRWNKALGLLWTKLQEYMRFANL